MGVKGEELGKITCGKKAKASDIIVILENQLYACALSGEKLDPVSAQLDHVIPVSKGGTHEAGNIQIVTREINRMKGTLSNDEFVAICKKVSEWNGGAPRQVGSP